MQILNNLIFLGLLALLAGCNLLPSMDEVLPDRRTEYQSSRDLPPLEVPPDLTSGSINDSMAIPGEEDANTLSAYEQQQRNAAIGPGSSGALPNEQALTLSGDRYSVWPELGRFLQEQGYALELNDAELGVLETGWLEPQAGADGEIRGRFNIFAEPGQDTDTTLLFISHEQQRRAGPDEPWNDAGSDAEAQQQMVAELNEFFGGPATTGSTTVADTGNAAAATPQDTGSSLPRAEIVNTEGGDVYLSLPSAYDQAWGRTETALNRVAGMQIQNTDSDAGEYLVAYAPPGSEEEKGWFDALKFWSDDEPPLYRIRLTEAGDQTDIVVQDEDGGSLSDDEERSILTAIQNEYNKQQ